MRRPRTSTSTPTSTPAGGFDRLARRALWASGWLARIVLIGLIRLYRATLSSVLGGQCRFDPSCSRYAEEAIRSRGATVGSGLAVWRILRCNPFARGGVDEPPSRRAYDAVIHRSGAA